MWITQPQVADAAARRMERKGKGKGRKAGAARTAPEAEPEPFTILRVVSGSVLPEGREKMQSFLGGLPREQWIDCVPLKGKPEYYEYFRECCGQTGVTAMAAAKHPRLPTILFQVADAPGGERISASAATTASAAALPWGSSWAAVCRQSACRWRGTTRPARNGVAAATPMARTTARWSCSRPPGWARAG